ncbi:hypothetical protein P0136_11850 [Lentisphaerota bacterium ZTH]|nr:hypothetical protein JYG24_10635 [Lentisphaerota bacterium]WET06050.1 hypothetical protein P0136_11850 [Lentisphaerota bacterium ZTH]
MRTYWRRLKRTTPVRRRQRFISRQLDRAFKAYSKRDLKKTREIIQSIQPHEHKNSTICLLNGMLALNEKRGSDALRFLSRAAAAKPDTVSREYFLGVALERCSQIKDAITQYRRVLELQPDYAPAIANLCHILGYTDLDEAFSVCSRGLSAHPKNSRLLATMGQLQLLRGMPGEAIHCFRRSLKFKPDVLEVRSGLIFAYNYFKNSTDRITSEAAKWEKILLNKNVSKRKFSFWDVLNLDLTVATRRLRIGYVSGDFRQHSVACFIEPLLQNHNTHKVEVFCYSDVEVPDEITARIKKWTPHWRDISRKTNEQVRKMIKNDRIDVLVDLFGHTLGKRLQIFGKRSAPVQVSYLGYPGSSGLHNIDFRIGDRYTDTEQSDGSCHEEIIRFKNGFWAYTPPANTPRVKALPCLDNGYFTYGSFNNQAKITPLQIKLWGKLLRSNLNTRILLKNSSLSANSVRQHVMEQFEAQGIASGRIILRGFEPEINSHLEIYNEVDVALDTFPYNGTTTTFEALWMGVPVVTMYELPHASRVGMAIMKRLGLEKFVASSEKAYLDIAANQPENIRGLIELRKSLRDKLRNSPFMDAKRVAEEMENAFRHGVMSYVSNILSLKLDW